MAGPSDTRRTMRVQPIDVSHRDWLTQLLEQYWGLPVVSISGAHDPTLLPGFVAEDSGELVGAVTYRTTDSECEVVTLNSLRPRAGVGTELLGAVKTVAERNGLRLWLITTDDNPSAIAFYEHRGMSRRAVHANFVDSVRSHKPQSPHGQPGYRDAIEFSY
jgi:ribosomal protein S18 acetylase RimI-like enzyme